MSGTGPKSSPENRRRKSWINAQKLILSLSKHMKGLF